MANGSDGDEENIVVTCLDTYFADDTERYAKPKKNVDT
jgi:hypothetical protein